MNPSRVLFIATILHWQRVKEHFTFQRKPFSPPAHFQWRKNGKNAVARCDGIGLGMLPQDHPIKREDIEEDIPDIKAFFSCEVDGAKSHLK
ncbi:hypothetical protein [Sphingobacterium sp. NPDC055431]